MTLHIVMSFELVAIIMIKPIGMLKNKSLLTMKVMELDVTISCLIVRKLYYKSFILNNA